MSIIFYDHLLVLEEIVITLDAISDLSAEDKKALLKHVESALHHEVVDEILSHLPRQFHEDFLTKFTNTPHDTALLEFLTQKTGIDMHKKILTRANKVKKKFIKKMKHTT